MLIWTTAKTEMKFKEHKAWFINAVEGRYTEREILQLYHRTIDHYLKMDRVLLKLKEEEVFPREFEEVFESAVMELNQGKPIDYILGETLFFGYPFSIDESVLIPRPETEELVLMIIEREKETALDILDIGTGSGCIPIAIALENKFYQVSACEISKDALKNAKQNAENLKANVEFFQMDILSEIPDKKFDIVVSNPPYVKREELNELQKSVVEYEPLIALSPEGDPLIFYKRMVNIAPQILNSGGRFYWEIHEDMGEEVVELLKGPHFWNVELKQDFYGRDRFVRAVYEQ